MSDLVVRTIPWSTKVESMSDFTDTGWGWTSGTNVIFNKHYNIGAQSSSNFSTNGITWYRQGVGEYEGNCNEMFTSDGFESFLDNGKAYNAVHFFGSRVDSSSFTDDDYTYDTNASSSFVKNAIGFASITETARSYSDSGNAQARLEKICFFYMDPANRKRHTYQLTEKIAGNKNINSDFSDKSQKWFSYRLKDSDISTVTTSGLELMGIGLQFFHDYKRTAASHLSANKLSQMRIICAENSSYLRSSKTHQLLYCIPTTHLVSEKTSPHSITLS